MTSGAADYRIRVIAQFKLNSSDTYTPLSYYGAVEVRSSGNGTGNFYFTLSPNLPSQIQVKLVRDNGEEITNEDYASGTYNINLHVAAFTRFEIDTRYTSFPKMKFNGAHTYTELNEVGLILNTVGDYNENVVSPYFTTLLPNIKPQTIKQGQKILTINNKTSGSTFTVSANKDLILQPGNSHLLTVALGPKDASIASFTISDLEVGGDLNSTNKYIVLDGDHYKIYNAKGMKAFSDIVNGAKNQYTINEIVISTTPTPNANGKLMRSIDLSSVCSESLQRSWDPIGSNVEYVGKFDGNGYTASNLYINKATESNLGLFGQLGAGSVITSLLLSDAYINAGKYAGVVAGKSNGGVIVSTIVTDVTVSATSSVGGVIGYNTANTKIISCLVPKVNLTLRGSGSIGGLIGNSTTDALNSYVLRSGRTFTGGVNESSVVDDIDNPATVSSLNSGITLWNSVPSNMPKCNFHFEVNELTSVKIPLFKLGAPTEI